MVPIFLAWISKVRSVIGSASAISGDPTTAEENDAGVVMRDRFIDRYDYLLDGANALGPSWRERLSL